MTDPDSETPAATVSVYPDGPLIVRGSFVIAAVDGTPIPHSGAAVALCRCGKSASKPFCDSSHKRSRPKTPPVVDDSRAH